MCAMKVNTTEATFTKFYMTNQWGGKESRSGPGSDSDQTRIIIKELPTLLSELNISTMLDIPCGDLNWMQHVELRNIDYTGADIVKPLIQKNTEKYGRNGVCFQHLDILEDKLPKKDLVLCRDCLVHFSISDVFLALNNICNSQSEYLLTTTYTDSKMRLSVNLNGLGVDNDNGDIVTGLWRPLNLELAPFMFPEPLVVINEGCTEHVAVTDKSLGLWRIADLRKTLTKHSSAPALLAEF